MKKLLLGLLVFSAFFSYASDIDDARSKCIDNICINDLVADESSSSGIQQVLDIEGSRLRIGKKGDRFTILTPIEGVHGNIVELNDCEEYSRFYECTYGEDNKRILGMKYNFDRETVEPYLKH